jgi:DNA-binding winged helix-turn-helix (wHTH) protein
MGNWKRYRVGQFVVESGERTISQNGTLHTLAPKEFDLLLLLIERRGQILEKQEILNAIWPDSYVTEGNLTQYIYRLRSLLGSEAIRTVPKRGYVLATSVAEEADGFPIPFIPRAWWIRAAILGCMAILVFAVGRRTNRFRPRPEAYDLYLRGQARLDASRSSRSEVKGADERRAALSLFRQAIELEPHYADAYGAMAETLCWANSDQATLDAEENARKALGFAPDNLNARTALICVAFRRGKQEETLRLAMEIRRMGASSTESSYAVGEGLLRAGLAQKSIGPLRTAVEKSPEVILYREELAFAWMLAGRPDECLAVLSPVLKKEEGGFWHAMNCLKGLGRYDEAVVYGEKLLLTEPENAAAYRALALSYSAAGRQRQAETVLNKGIRRFEGIDEIKPSTRNRIFLALMNAHLGRRDQVVRWVHAAESLDPQNSWVLFQAGLAYGILGDDPAAMEFLERSYAQGFTLKYYFDWQIRPDMGVPTLSDTERYKKLERSLEERVADLDASVR